MTRNNSGGLIHEAAAKSAYDWYVSGLRTYGPGEGPMARTFHSSRPRRSPKRNPIRPQPLSITGQALGTPKAVRQSNGFYQPNGRAGDTFYKTDEAAGRTLYRPTSATTFKDQQERAIALSQPKWREVPFEKYVVQKDRENIAKRKIEYQNRLFSVN